MMTRMAGALALVLVASGCTAGPSTDSRATERTSEIDASQIRLVAFDSCKETLDALRKAAAEHGVGFGEFAYRNGAAKGTMPEAPIAGAPQPAVPDAAAAPGGDNAGNRAGNRAGDTSLDHSTTNNHESGVDEADLVKTDGRRIVTVVDGTLRVVDAKSRRVAGSLNLDLARGKDGDPYGFAASQLLLHKDRALVIVNRQYGFPMPVDDLARQGMPADIMPHPGQIGGSRLVLVDLAGSPRVLGSLTVDGAYLDARQIGATARVVVKSGPRLPYRYPDGVKDPAQVDKENRDVVAKSTPEQWLPRFELEQGGRKEKGHVGCGDVVRPAEYTGQTMLTVYTFDLAKALTSGDPLTVVADGETVYATGSTLYVAHGDWGNPVAQKRRPGGSVEQTEIHQFDIGKPGRPRYSASGAVPGALLNQYAMSEHDGHLRVATTSTRYQPELWKTPEADSPPPRTPPQPQTQSSVYVLSAEGRTLTQVGRVDGLGKGERIYAVRFAGDLGYVVTFRQTDPVYTLDLRDPRRPRVTGELKINGYSAYLHPVDDKTLIGIGQEATGEGRQLGTQVSVFDVSDPAKPRRVAQHHVRDSSSEAEFDPHAFLYWPRTGTLVIPLMLHTGPQNPGALILELKDGLLTERGVVRHPATAKDPSIRRSLVIDDTLWTVSASGLRAGGVTSLVEQSWIPF